MALNYHKNKSLLLAIMTFIVIVVVVVVVVVAENCGQIALAVAAAEEIKSAKRGQDVNTVPRLRANDNQVIASAKGNGQFENSLNDATAELMCHCCSNKFTAHQSDNDV